MTNICASTDRLERIFGVDPGSHVVGFALLEVAGPLPQNPRRFEVCEVGTLRVDQKLDFSQRIGRLHKGLYQVVESCRPTICVMEKAFVGPNVQSAIRLGEARGALLSALARFDIVTTHVSPTAVKKMIAGHGQASKQQVSMALETLINIDCSGLRHDATDALAIALAYGLGTTH